MGETGAVSLMGDFTAAFTGALVGLWDLRVRRLLPVISLGLDTPSISSRVGATSARMPSLTVYSAASAAT